MASGGNGRVIELSMEQGDRGISAMSGENLRTRGETPVPLWSDLAAFGAFPALRGARFAAD
jgi:hypothetical protein